RGPKAIDMASNGIEPGTGQGVPIAHTQPNLLGDENHKSFRRKLGSLAIVLLLVNLGIGLFAYSQQRTLVGYAVSIYDHTFASIADNPEKLNEPGTNILVRARNGVAELAQSSEFLVLSSLLTSIMLAGLALLSLDRLVSAVNRSRAQLSA